jgi:hypothetical protein
MLIGALREQLSDVRAILNNYSCEPLTSRYAVAYAIPQLKQPICFCQQSFAEKS